MSSTLNSDKVGDIFSEMRSPPSALLPILRSQVAGDLLALLYLHPEAEPHKETNRAHAKLRAPGERANAKLKVRTALTIGFRN